MNNLFSYIKISKEILKFGNTEIEINRFYRHRNPIFWEMQILKKY